MKFNNPKINPRQCSATASLLPSGELWKTISLCIAYSKFIISLPEPNLPTTFNFVALSIKFLERFKILLERRLNPFIFKYKNKI